LKVSDAPLVTSHDTVVGLPAVTVVGDTDDETTTGGAVASALPVQAVKVCSVIPPSDEDSPTAVQLVALEQATPRRSPEPPAGFGLATIDQLVPSQDPTNI
jgi:hypothetical protein